MNSKFKRLVASAAVFALTASSFTGLSITVSAATGEVDYIGSSSAAETFDSYTVNANGSWDGGVSTTLSNNSGIYVADESTLGGVSGNALVVRAAGKSGGYTGKYTLTNSVSSGTVTFNTVFTPNQQYAHDGALISIVDSEGNNVLSFSYGNTGNNRIRVEANGGAKPYTDASSDYTLRGKAGVPFGITATLNLDTKKATISVSHNGTNVALTAAEVGLATGTTVGGLNVAVANSRTGGAQWNDIVLDDTKFYAVTEIAGGGNGGSSDPTPEPAGETGTKKSLAAADATWAFGSSDLKYEKNGLGSATKADSYAISYAKEGLFDDPDTAFAPQAINVPFVTLPGAGTVVELYAGVDIPVNLSNGIVEKNPVTGLTTLYRSDLAYLGSGIPVNSYVDLAGKTPFATLTFSEKDKKTMVSVNGGTAAEVKNNTVAIPVNDTMAAALDGKESLLVNVKGAADKVPGSLGTISIEFPAPQPVDVTVGLPVYLAGDGFVGKVNTDKLVSIKTDLAEQASEKGKVKVYGVSSYGTKLTDADLIGSADVAKNAASATVTVKVNADKPFIYIVGEKSDKIKIKSGSAKANYTFDPYTDGDAKKTALDQEYFIVNKQIQYQQTAPADINKTDVQNTLTNIDGYSDEIKEACANEIKYIDQTKKGLEVRETCAAVISAINGDDSYANLKNYRTQLKNAYEQYKGLLVAGMRCVDNITTITEYLDKLDKHDAGKADEYKAAVDAVADITGLTKDENGEPVFDAALIDGGKDFETKAQAVADLNTLVDDLSAYDDTTKEAIAAKAGDAAAAATAANDKVEGFKADAAKAFKTAFDKVEAAFTAANDSDGDAAAKSAAKSAALKIDGIDKVYTLISADDELKTAINSGYDNAYDKYTDYNTELLAYNTAQDFLSKLKELKENVEKANGVNKGNYETLAEQLNEVNDLYVRYNTLTNNGTEKIDTATAGEVVKEAAYIEDAKYLLDQAAEEIVKPAKEAIEALRTDSSETTGKNLLNAEYQYGLLGKNGKAYLDTMTVPEGKTNAGMKYSQALAANRELCSKTILPKNLADIEKYIADNDDAYKAFVSGLDYEDVVTYNEEKKTYATADYSTWIANYKDKVDKLSKINSYINGSVKSYNESENKYDYNQAATAANVKAVDKAFNIQNKLKAIYDFRAAIYDGNNMTKVAGTTQAIIDLVYSGATYETADVSETALADAVKAAYDDGKIDYKSDIANLAGHTGAGADTINAFKTEYDNYKAAYDAYTKVITEDATEYTENENDMAQLEVGKKVYDAITSYLASEKAADEGTENNRAEKEATAKEEVAAVTEIINALENNATLAGYTASDAVAADKATLAEVKARVEADKADADKKYTAAGVYAPEENYFVTNFPSVTESKLVTVETALNFWDEATKLYDNVVAGIAAADLKNGSHADYDAAKAAVNDAADQQKIYFNDVAENNDNATIIEDMDAKIAVYNAVNGNIKVPAETIGTPATISEYNSKQAAFDAVTAYIADIAEAADGENEDKVAKDNKANELYNSDEYADVRAKYDELKAVFDVIKPAADFDKAVYEAFNETDNDAKYAEVKEAIRLYNAMVNKTEEGITRSSLDYIGEDLTNVYTGLVLEYRDVLKAEFETAYDAVVKGSLVAPVDTADEAWQTAKNAALDAYALMYKDDQKAAADKFEELNGLEAANAEYAEDNATAKAQINKINNAYSAYANDKDADKANKAIDEIEKVYNALVEKYGEADVRAVITNYNMLVDLKEAIRGNAEKEAALEAYNAAVAKLDIDNVTIDSYNDIEDAKEAWANAVAVGAMDETTGYGVIYACDDKFNELDTVKKAKADADALHAMIEALPSVASAKEVIVAAQEDIMAAKAAYDALTATAYGKSLVSTADNTKLAGLLEVLNVTEAPKYDFNGDGDVDIFDLNMAILAAFGRDVKVYVNGEETDTTVASVVDTNNNGSISLIELRDVIRAFSANEE